jgi:hypothetical protein
MIDASLTWFGRIWITVVVLAMLAFYFDLPSTLTDDWAAFHVGWVPMIAVPNPANVLWWTATVLVALPGIGALVLRNKLRERIQRRRIESMFAVAIRDGKDLFLWFRIRRAIQGDIYYMIPTGRSGAEWKKWNPHGSQHKDGRYHNKSFGQKIFPRQRQKPDSKFKGTETMVIRPTAAHEPRAFGVTCDPAEFLDVMEVPASLLSAETYKTHISIDLTEPGSQPIITPGSQVLAQHAFKDAIPLILVSVIADPPR